MTRSRRLAVAGLLAVLSVAAACSRDSSAPGWRPSWPLLPHDDHLTRHPDYRHWCQVVLDSFEPAASRVSRALGMPVAARQFQYRLRATPPGKGDGHLARTLHLGDGRPATVEIYLEPLLSGAANPADVLAHELAHATLEKRMGESYGKLPRWLSEGLAVHAAGETEAKARYAIAWTRRESAELLADGLTTPHRWCDYAEDGFAMQHLERVAGDDAIARLVDRLAGGDAWEEAITAVTGRPHREFLRGAREHARTELRRIAGEHDAQLREGSRAALLGWHEKALRLLEPVLASGEGPLLTPALVHAAKARLSLGDATGAEELFAQLLDQRRPELESVRSTLLHSARARWAAGDEGGARARCDELSEIYPYSEQARGCRSLIGDAEQR